MAKTKTKPAAKKPKKEEPTPLARFLALTRVEEDTGCRMWIGADDKDEYGQFADNGTHQAHRWIWEHLHGPITQTDSQGRLLELDHRCRRRKCTNTYKDPDMPNGIGGCLELVTHEENMRRQREAQRVLKQKLKAEQAADLETKLEGAKKAIEERAVELAKESPLEDTFRKREMCEQAAGLIMTRNRWVALEQLGELEPEKSRQLSRIGSEIKKLLDELGIEQAKGKDKKSIGFLGMREKPKRK